MQGVVSLLDDRHYARVEAIWEELGQKFDVRGLYVTPYPHFSFQVAEQYDESACAEFLSSLAARTKPFRVRKALAVALDLVSIAVGELGPGYAWRAWRGLVLCLSQRGGVEMSEVANTSGTAAAARYRAPARLLEWMRARSESELRLSSMLRRAPAEYRQRDVLREALQLLLDHGLIVEIAARPRAFRVVRDRTPANLPTANSQPANSQPSNGAGISRPGEVSWALRARARGARSPNPLLPRTHRRDLRADRGRGVFALCLPRSGHAAFGDRSALASEAPGVRAAVCSRV